MNGSFTLPKIIDMLARRRLQPAGMPTLHPLRSPGGGQLEYRGVEYRGAEYQPIRISGGAEYRGAEWQVIKKLRPTGISGGLNVGSRLLPQSCTRRNPPSDAAGFDIIT
ncbi:hypothetical protein [Bartonella choladocola]|uniref:hypothetical protein n=1 Tax=Bartonella choladocola TaxID=2750995 RepID=UPI003B52CA26